MSTKKNKNILQIELFNEYILNKLLQGSIVNHPHSDLTSVTYKGIYSMHKYWGKKPHNIVRSFIERYTEEGHIVMVPFCGSGVTAIEALLTRRKAIAIDLNPIATFITRATLLPVYPIDIEMEYKRIWNTVEHKINELYLTRCTRCGTTAVGTHFIWEGNVMKKYGAIVKFVESVKLLRYQIKRITDVFTLLKHSKSHISILRPRFTRTHA
jgi:hypothetical protein